MRLWISLRPLVISISSLMDRSAVEKGMAQQAPAVSVPGGGHGP
jgi:hypothetical protein